METQRVATGRRLGRYTLVEHIADGGMASVFLARLQTDQHFGKWVAIKVIHDRHAGDPLFERMFLTEARIVAQVDHPNVAAVFDSGIVDGTCYLAMEYMSGETLHRVAQQAKALGKPLPRPLAARIVESAAMGLHAAHELRDNDGASLNVVHRDVSPQNIFVLHSGATKLMDFGIAHSMDRDDSEATAIDQIKGKFAYMSPEQLQRAPLDRRCDIFCLGIVLWELTCGARLFKRGSTPQTAMAVLSDDVPLPSSLVPDYPPALERIVMKALERDPDARFATASEFAHSLEEYIASTGVPAGPPQIGDLMADLFPEAVGECSSSLRRAAALLASLDSIDLQSGVRAAAAPSEPSVESSAVEARPRSRWRGLAFASALVSAMILGAVLMRESAPPAQSEEVTTTAVSSVPAAPEAAPDALEASQEVTASASDASALVGSDPDPPESPRAYVDAPRRRAPMRRAVSAPTPEREREAEAPRSAPAPTRTDEERAPAAGQPAPMTDFE